MKKIENEGFNLYEILGETMVMPKGVRAVIRYNAEDKTMRGEEVEGIKVRKGEKLILIIAKSYDEVGSVNPTDGEVINGLWQKARRWRKNTHHYSEDRLQVKFYNKVNGELVGYAYTTKADGEETTESIKAYPIVGIVFTLCDKEDTPDFVSKDSSDANTNDGNAPASELTAYVSVAKNTDFEIDAVIKFKGGKFSAQDAIDISDELTNKLNELIESWAY